MSGILQQQNSLLNRVEEVLTENQKLKTEFKELTEREETLSANCGECTRSIFCNFSQDRRDTLH